MQSNVPSVGGLRVWAQNREGKVKPTELDIVFWDRRPAWIQSRAMALVGIGQDPRLAQAKAQVRPWNASIAFF